MKFEIRIRKSKRNSSDQIARMFQLGLIPLFNQGAAVVFLTAAGHVFADQKAESAAKTASQA
jgi:hypothetical protein